MKYIQSDLNSKKINLIKTFFGHVFHRIFDQHIDDGVKISAGFMENAELIVGRSSPFENRVDVLDLFARIELIDDVVDEIEQLADEILDRDFLLLAEVEQLSVEPVANRAPFVFLDEAAVIK